MTQRLVHLPARATRPSLPPAPRTIEPPPNLPEGKTGTPATALLPMAGVLSSVVMMTVVRSSRFAGLGAVVLVVALLGAVALFLSQRGKAQRQRRERYLEYLEELRAELGAPAGPGRVHARRPGRPGRRPRPLPPATAADGTGTGRLRRGPGPALPAR